MWPTIMKRGSIYFTFVRLVVGQVRAGQKTSSINITRKIVTESWKPNRISYVLSIWYQTESGGITFFLCILLSQIKLLFAFYYIVLYTLFNVIATLLYNPSFHTKSVWNETILIHDHDKLDRIKCSCCQPSDSANTYIHTPQTIGCESFFIFLGYKELVELATCTLLSFLLNNNILARVAQPHCRVAIFLMGGGL